MRIILLSLFFIATSSVAQNISFSFDDGLNPTRQPKAEQWNQAILRHLEQNNSKAIFFVTGRNVNSPKGLDLVRNWGEQGHALGNHTYSHPSLNSKKVTLADYLKDMEKNHQLLKDFPGWTNKFRFPYLKEGKTAEKRDGVRNWFKKNNYLPGPVSVDSSDWYYNQHYLKLLKNGEQGKLPIIKKAYLDHLWNRAQYYDSLSVKALKRSVDHVLLLHVNAINAAFLGDVIKMFREKGWNIISPLKAFEDPAYKQQPDVLPAGESLLWQLAKQKGVEDLRYPGEDSRYERAKIDKLLGGK